MKVEDIQREILRQNYQWPSYDGFITRCLTRYSIVSEKNGIPIYDMFTKPNTDDNRWICRGTLLPRPGCVKEGIHDVEVPFINYTIDFGNDREDTASRGYWVESSESDKQVWYKMESPSPEFAEQHMRMEIRLSEFMFLHDSLAQSKAHPRQLMVCAKPVQDFLMESKKPFSLAFLKDNAAFVLDNLGGSLDALPSVLFIHSVGQLGGLDDARVRKPFGLTKGRYQKELGAAKERYRLIQQQQDKGKRNDAPDVSLQKKKQLSAPLLASTGIETAKLADSASGARSPLSSSSSSSSSSTREGQQLQPGVAACGDAAAVQLGRVMCEDTEKNRDSGCSDIGERILDMANGGKQNGAGMVRQGDVEGIGILSKKRRCEQETNTTGRPSQSRNA